MNWHQLTTQGRIDAIRSVWRPGMSAAQIAAHFDGMSRNAVIGIFHRHAKKIGSSMYLGVKGENGQEKPRARRSSPKAARKRRLRVVKPANPAPVAVSVDPITLTQLNGHTCRFPVGEIAGEHQLFCGQWCDIDQPYCDHHMEIAHGPGTESERSADRAARHVSQQAA